MSLLISVFPKVFTPKEVVTWTSKAPFFRTPFGNQRVQEFQTLSKSALHHYYPIVPWIWDKLSWKKCRLVRFEILRLFVNTLAADDKYSRRYMRNFPQQIQTALSSKEKNLFLDFWLYFWILQQIWKTLKNKMSFLGWSMSEIIDSERGGYLKTLLQNTFQQWKCSRVTNTAEISTASLLFYCSMNRR